MPYRAAPIPPLYCQLCGVSSAIGRLRTKDEPPCSGWSSTDAASICNHGSGCRNCFTIYESDDEEIAGDESPDEQEYQYSSDEDAAADPYEYDSPAESDQEDKENQPEETSSQVKAQKLWINFMEDLPNPAAETIVPFAAGTDNQSEHIAGPDCVSSFGYNGNSISAEEMKGCNTFQALCPKPRGRKWRNLEDDQDFEKDPDSTVCLSGLCDWIDNRKKNARQFFPFRHNVFSPLVGNHVDSKQPHRSAFIFHPACFEVFKRASLHRNGKVDVEALMEWYRAEGTPGGASGVPRSGEVLNARGEDTAWTHVAGEEWLVANPCHVPQLENFLEQSTFDTKSPPAYSKDDVVAMYPWLWEAWCDAPYAGWSNTTEYEMQSRVKTQETRRSDLEWSIHMFEKEEAMGGNEYPHLDELREELEDLKDSNPGVESCSVLNLDRDFIQWSGVMENLEAGSRGLKGLRNRERIWKDCQYILQRIELHSQQSEIEGVMNLDLADTDDVDITLTLDWEFPQA